MRNASNSTREYLRLIGVADLPPLTSPFDPGYDPVTLEGHLEQSAHLMATLKISMACWQIDSEGKLNAAYADRFAQEFGLDVAMFEAPNKPSQFAFLEHFGPHVHLCNVRLEELLRVEIFRRGLHSDAFAMPNLRPARPASETSR